MDRIVGGVEIDDQLARGFVVSIHHHRREQALDGGRIVRDFVIGFAADLGGVFKPIESGLARDGCAVGTFAGQADAEHAATSAANSYKGLCPDVGTNLSPMTINHRHCAAHDFNRTGRPSPAGYSGEGSRLSTTGHLEPFNNLPNVHTLLSAADNCYANGDDAPAHIIVATEAHVPSYSQSAAR